MKKIIMFICTMDTKSVEIEFAASVARENGCDVLILDTSTKDIFSSKGDVTPIEILKYSGMNADDFLPLDKGQKIEYMARAVIKYTSKMYHEKLFDGIMCIGGGQNSRMAAAAMKELPFGVPKMIVSTLASGKRAFEIYMGSKDIVVMSPVIDIAGLNSISKMIINNAVSAMVGMVNTAIGVSKTKDRTRVAATMLGITTKGTSPVVRFLEDSGKEVTVFHANGVGGAGMEKLMEDNYFDLILDINLHEITCEYLGGFCVGAYKRLEIGAKKGLPQIIVPGAVDVLDLAVAIDTREAVLESIKDRQYYFHNAEIIHSKITKKEAVMIAEIIAERINQVTGPTKVILPLEGFCEAGAPGMTLYNKEVDEAFICQFKNTIDKRIDVIEVDANINEEKFTKVLMEQTNLMIELIEKKEEEQCS